MIGASSLPGRLLGGAVARRMLACGCISAAALVVAPAFLLLAALKGLVGGVDTTAGTTAEDPGAAGLIVAAGEPLPPGRFTVSQGFGCTAVGLEPPPPRSYTCPPNAAHRGFVRFHTGIDLAAATGVVVFAVSPGTVHLINAQTGFGSHILLIPSAPASASIQYLYGHLSGFAVADGDTVRAGAPIGFVGSTGNSSGSHLHFEVDVGGLPVNPCPSFPAGYLVPASAQLVDCAAWAM